MWYLRGGLASTAQISGSPDLYLQWFRSLFLLGNKRNLILVAFALHQNSLRGRKEGSHASSDGWSFSSTSWLSLLSPSSSPPSPSSSSSSPSSSSHTGCTSVGEFICVLLIPILETPSIFTDFLTTHVLIDDHHIEMWWFDLICSFWDANMEGQKALFHGSHHPQIIVILMLNHFHVKTALSP